MCEVGPTLEEARAHFENVNTMNMVVFDVYKVVQPSYLKIGIMAKIMRDIGNSFQMETYGAELRINESPLLMELVVGEFDDPNETDKIWPVTNHLMLSGDHLYTNEIIDDLDYSVLYVLDIKSEYIIYKHRVGCMNVAKDIVLKRFNMIIGRFIGNPLTLYHLDIYLLFNALDLGIDDIYASYVNLTYYEEASTDMEDGTTSIEKYHQQVDDIKQESRMFEENTQRHRERLISIIRETVRNLD